MSKIPITLDVNGSRRQTGDLNQMIWKVPEIIAYLSGLFMLKAGDLIHPCRVALTGQTRSAGIFEVMELVGAPRVLARLRRAVAAQA